MSTLALATHRGQWKAQLAELASFARSEPFDVAALADAAADLLSRFSGAATSVYRPVRQEAGFAIRFWGRKGIGQGFADDFRALLAAPPSNDGGLFFFDPTRPDPRERNAVRVIAPVENSALAAASRVFRQHGLAKATQTRMLVCDGPLMLSWVGVFRDELSASRERHARTAKRDAWLVASLGRALRRPMRLLHGLPPDGHALFEAVLEALSEDAYLVTRSGRIETANSRGVAHLGRGLRAERAELTRAIDAHLCGAPSGPFEVHPLRVGQELYIVHRRPRPLLTGIELRVEEARARWNLSAQQAAVLRELGEGGANKEIADRLSISVRTVEKHVETIALKAGVASRLRLVAELWRPRDS